MAEVLLAPGQPWRVRCPWVYPLQSWAAGLTVGLSQGPAWETGRRRLLGHFCGNVCANRSMKAEMRC